jgi:hypothetical protein
MQNNILVTGGVRQEQAGRFGFLDGKNAWNLLDAESGDKLA